MSTPDLQIQQIVDVYIRRNFQNLSDYFNAQNQLLNFLFSEQEFTGPVTEFQVAHNLGSAPQDIILTRLTGPGSVKFEYGKFDTKYIYLSTTGACRVRFLYGTYFNFQSKISTEPTDSLTYSGGT